MEGKTKFEEGKGGEVSIFQPPQVVLIATEIKIYYIFIYVFMYNNFLKIKKSPVLSKQNYFYCIKLGTLNVLNAFLKLKGAIDFAKNL